MSNNDAEASNISLMPNPGSQLAATPGQVKTPTFISPPPPQPLTNTVGFLEKGSNP
jgi:hypothetical protein